MVDKDVLLAEFEQLRAEILSRQTRMTALVSTQVVTFGAAIATKSARALLGAAVISLSLWIIYLHQESSVQGIGHHIRFHLAPALGEGSLGWETRHDRTPDSVKGLKLPRWFVYLPFIGPALAAVVSYFLIRGLEGFGNMWPFLILSVLLFAAGLVIAVRLTAYTEWARTDQTPPKQTWWELFKRFVRA